MIKTISWWTKSNSFWCLIHSVISKAQLKVNNNKALLNFYSTKESIQWVRKILVSTNYHPYLWSQSSASKIHLSIQRPKVGIEVAQSEGLHLAKSLATDLRIHQKKKKRERNPQVNLDEGMNQLISTRINLVIWSWIQWMTDSKLLLIQKIKALQRHFKLLSPVFSRLSNLKNPLA